MTQTVTRRVPTKPVHTSVARQRPLLNTLVVALHSYIAQRVARVRRSVPQIDLQIWRPAAVCCSGPESEVIALSSKLAAP